MPISQQGKYVLVLKFSEVYFNSPAEKIFDIAIGNENILKSIDVYSKVGKATAYDEYIELDFRNNKVYVQNKPIEGAYNEDSNTIAVSFKKGERDNPKINAILLVKGSLTDTDYEFYKGQFEELERQRMSKERVLFNVLLLI